MYSGLISNAVLTKRRMNTKASAELGAAMVSGAGSLDEPGLCATNRAVLSDGLGR